MTQSIDPSAVLANRAALRAWLQAKADADPAQIVGHACNGGNCPAARWLRASGLDDAVVGNHSVGFGDAYRAPLPFWLQDFVRAVDALARHRPSDFPLERTMYEIQADEALAVLDEVPADA